MDKWTKCYEKMPEDRQLVLAQYSDGYLVPSMFYKGTFYDTTQLWEIMCQDDITEWMPLNIDDSKWIKTSDRLPEDSDELVLVKYKVEGYSLDVLGTFIGPFTGFYFVDRYGTLCEPDEVDAWLPLDELNTTA